MVAKKKKYSKYTGQDKFLISLLIVLDILIVSFLIFSNIKIYSEAKHINNQYVNINKEIEQIEERNQELKELFALETQEDTERFLREKGLYKKPGEEVVVIKRGGDISSDKGIVAESASFWDKVAEFFRSMFGRD